MRKDEISGSTEKNSTSYLSILQSHKSMNTIRNTGEVLHQWFGWQQWAEKYLEIDIKHTELKEYYRWLVEDLKDSIWILLKDYIKSKSVSLHLSRFLEKISHLRKEKYELKVSLLQQTRNFSLMHKHINESLKWINNYK